jgi:hypothetical protein
MIASMRMERRGQCEWFIVGATHDGRPAETKISPTMTFVQPGLP